MRFITILGTLGTAGVAAGVASVLIAQSKTTNTTNTPTVAGAEPKAVVTATQNPTDGIPKYKPVSGTSGNLSSIGSDTLNNLMTHWVEGFQREYPAVKIQVEGKGSGSAPPALTSGTAQLAPMSRMMKDDEIDLFEKKFGYKPTGVKVAIDALTVYVNKDNPTDKLTLAQIDAIFSKTRKGGASEDITTWGQLGLKDDWASKPISVYGRNSSSGTYGYFKEHALFKGDFRETVKEQSGSGGVVEAVTADKYGIGYSGIGYKTSGVKSLQLADKDGKPFYTNEAENVYAGKYPLSRFLYVYVNKEPNKRLDPLVREMLKYILSEQGQAAVATDEFFPLTAPMVKAELAKFEGVN